MKRKILPIGALPAWARLNGVAFSTVAVEQLPGRGSGVVATDVIDENEANVMMLVPRDLVLSQELVWEIAKSDHHLRSVLESVGDFARTARGSILIFLLHQLTRSCPDVTEPIGLHNAFTEYVQLLPENIPLPTFYTDNEIDLLYGTSLDGALKQKFRSLDREYDLLREKTGNIDWCSRVWWDDDTGHLTFDDWKTVDAMYRSRALDMPGIGHATVPCIDMANHASGEKTVAVYEGDGQGNAVLQLREGKKLIKGDEITITYGDEKGACEMIFSYGFLEDTMATAEQIFLDLDIPDDDPLRMAKKMSCKDAPGFRLHMESGEIGWEGDFLWWICVNEEDGLDFRVLQTNNGSRELRASWKGQELHAGVTLRSVLSGEPMWDIFHLRAIVTLQQRVERQMMELQEGEAFVHGGASQSDVSADVLSLIVRLRELESALLEKAYGHFENQKVQLMSSEVVQTYFGSQSAENGAAEEDFS